MKSSEKHFAVYIHWPYCLSKCPYCDFSSRVCSDIDESLLWQGYQRDIQQWIKGGAIQSIFFGGGTPSLMTPKLTEKIINEIAKYASLSADCEITMEANPDAIDLFKLRDFKSLGVNRLSLGVQALSDSDLHFLGRKHTLQTACQRIDEAKTVFDRINIDLIYARPNQTLTSWKKELKKAIEFGLSHYSLYQLTIEENTVFGQKKIKPADEKTAADLYRLTDDIMAAAGLPAYEVSNYARLGQECRHNLTYWYGQDYIGIGPAAHGRIGTQATQNPKSITDWIKNGANIEILTPQEKRTEQLLMGLRLRRHWFPKKGLSVSKINRLVKQGYLEENQTGIRPTLSGTLILDKIVLDLLPD